MRWPGQRRRRWQLRAEAASRRGCATAPTALASVAIRRRRIEFNKAFEAVAPDDQGRVGFARPPLFGNRLSHPCAGRHEARSLNAIR